jgi:hypothetical protein
VKAIQTAIIMASFIGYWVVGTYYLRNNVMTVYPNQAPWEIVADYYFSFMGLLAFTGLTLFIIVGITAMAGAVYRSLGK